MEMGKSTPFGFLAQQNRFDGCRYTTVEELNRKKDVVCLILSYPPMNSVNKERHKNWVRDVLNMDRKTRDQNKFPCQFEINALLDHKFDDIEAYVPPRIIVEMCKKTLPVTQPDEKVLNLAVNFATRQILEEIENPEVRRIRISGRDGIRLTAEVKGLPHSCLRVIPPLFFQRMPMLQILNLSHTKIRSLPQSLYGLVQLQGLVLRGCKLFMELPPEVGKLSNLKVLELLINSSLK